MALAIFAQDEKARLPFEQTDSSGPAPVSIVIPSGQKFIMQLETALHSRTTRQGDRVEFLTAADVVSDNQVAIPEKSLIRATVIRAKRAGRLFGRAEIQLRFDDVKLPDGTVLPIRAAITRMGFDPVDPKTGEDPKLKAGSGEDSNPKAIATGSAQGAIIGVLSGGPKGAMYGAAAGAAITIAQMAIKRGPDVDLPRSTMFEAQFEEPINIPAQALKAQRAPTAESAAADPVASAAISMENPVSASAPVNTAGEQASTEIAEAKPLSKASETLPAEQPADVAGGAVQPIPSIATISVNVRMVQVDAVVRNKAGRLIDNLTADDFRIYEDGVLQEIQSFSRDELPLAVALVVDRSASVENYIAALRRIAVQALNQLKPQDEVCLFSFADTVDRLEDLTTDRRRIANALDRIRAGGGTDITDALNDSVSYLARSAPGRRHAVILVSDNQQTTSPRASDSATIKLAVESETVVYSLKASGDPLYLGAQIPTLIMGSGPVNKIARETGGEVINVGQASSLDSALESIIKRLRMRYSLGYYPAGTAQGGAFHAIAVRLADRHGKQDSDYFIHAKRGYYATGRSATSTAADYHGATAPRFTP